MPNCGETLITNYKLLLLCKKFSVKASKFAPASEYDVNYKQGTPRKCRAVFKV